MRYYWKDKEKRAKIAKKHFETMEQLYKFDIKESADNSIIYSPQDKFYLPKGKLKKIDIELVKIDAVSAIEEYAKNGKTATLNFASYKEPGGKFLEGSLAQEESLCHNSYLYNVLRQFPEYYIWNNKNLNHSLYTNRAIYSPNIRFNKVCCDIITCAAPNISLAKKWNKKEILSYNEIILEERIKFVLDIAAEHQVDTLILGAFGCDIFGQDPQLVIGLFAKYLISSHKLFNKVVFAIPDEEGYNKAFRILKEIKIYTTL